jgi:hypothetical protein
MRSTHIVCHIFIFLKTAVFKKTDNMRFELHVKSGLQAEHNETVTCNQPDEVLCRSRITNMVEIRSRKQVTSHTMILLFAPFILRSWRQYNTFLETSISFYQTTWRKIPDDNNFHSDFHEYLKSNIKEIRLVKSEMKYTVGRMENTPSNFVQRCRSANMMWHIRSKQEFWNHNSRPLLDSGP